MQALNWRLRTRLSRGRSLFLCASLLIACEPSGSTLGDDFAQQPATEESADRGRADRAAFEGDLGGERGADQRGLASADLGDLSLDRAVPTDASPSLDRDLRDQGLPEERVLVATLSFDDQRYDERGWLDGVDPKPGRGITVELRSVEGEERLAVVRSTMDGEVYLPRSLFDAPPPALGEVKLIALSQVEEQGLLSRVETAAEGRIYALESAPFSLDAFRTSDQGVAPAPLQLHGARESPVSAALHIADLAGEALRFIRKYSDKAASPALRIRWSPGHPFACGSCYQRDRISLGGQPEDPDQYDDHIILHEIGHWFASRFSDDDSPGGPHRARMVSPTLAFGEGLAYFWASMILRAPLMIDCTLEGAWVVDIEAPLYNGSPIPLGVAARGRQREELTSSLLWDAFDAVNAAEPWDQLELGEAEMMSLFLEALPREGRSVGPEGIDLSDWLYEASCRYPEDREALDLLAASVEHPSPSELEEEGSRCAQEKGTLDPYRIRADSEGLWLELREGEDIQGKVEGTLSPLTVRRHHWPEAGLKSISAPLEQRRCPTLPCQLWDRATPEASALFQIELESAHGKTPTVVYWRSWQGEMAAQRRLSGRQSADRRLQIYSSSK